MQASKPTIVFKDKNIELIFPGRRYLLFKKFLRKNKISHISEIDEKLIESFRNTKGVGVAKYKEILTIYNYALKYDEKSVDELSYIEENISSFLYTHKLKKIVEYRGFDYAVLLDKLFGFEDDNTSYDMHYQNLREYADEYNRTIELLKEKEAKELIFIESKKRVQLIENMTNVLFYPYFQKKQLCEVIDLFDIEVFKVSESQLKESLENNLNNLDIELLELIEKEIAALSQLERKLSNLYNNELNSRVKEIFDLRGQGYSLRETGKIMGLSGERIRQLEDVNFSKVTKSVGRYLNILSKEYFGERPYTELSDFFNYIAITDIEYRRLIKLWFIKNPNYHIKSNKVMTDNFYIKFFKNKSVIKYEELSSITVDYNQAMMIFSENSRFHITQPLLITLMKEYGYKPFGNNFILRNTSSHERLAYIFKRYFDENKIKIDENSLVFISDKMKEIFDEEMGTNNHSLENSIESMANIIKTDPHTYYWCEDEISDEDLLSIKRIIDAEIKLSGYVNTKELYPVLELEKFDIPILSPTHFYNIVKVYLDEDYLIGVDNSLRIFPKGTKNTEYNKVALLEKLVEAKGPILSKRYIMDNLDWELSEVTRILGKSDKLIPFMLPNCESTVRLFSSFNMTTIAKQELSTIIKKRLGKNNYIWVYDILVDMKKEPYFKDKLRQNNFENLYNLAVVIKKIFPEFIGSSQFLYVKEHKITAGEIVLSEFKDIVNHKEFINIFYEKGYSYSAIREIRRDLLKKKYIYPYTTESFIKSVVLQLTEIKIAELASFVESSKIGKERLSPKSFKINEQLRQLTSPYEPTALLIESILK